MPHPFSAASPARGRLRAAPLWGGLLLASLLSLAPVCGSDLGDRAPGEPCTRDAECHSGLECRGGTCRQLSDGGGALDAALDSSAFTD